MKKKSIAKLAVLVVFLISSLVAMSLPATREFLSHENLSSILDDLGGWAYLVYILIYAALVTLTLPGTIITVAGAALFPLFEAFGLTLIGAMLGATISFSISRALGREAIQEFMQGAHDKSKIFEKIATLIESFEANGTMAIAYLRIAYMPFSILNYAAPLTGVSFRQYTIGTFLGILPGTFVFVFLGNTLSEAWRQGDLGALYTWQTPVAIGLFSVSLLLPKLLKRFENRSKTPDNS